MKKAAKNVWITFIIIIAVIILAFLVLRKNTPTTDIDTAKCIGAKSVLYVQLGCSHCKDQEEMFGDNLQYLNTVDCFYQREICTSENITGTPTWIIKGEQYVGVQSIEQLKTLTGC